MAFGLVLAKSKKILSAGARKLILLPWGVVRLSGIRNPILHKVCT